MVKEKGSAKLSKSLQMIEVLRCIFGISSVYLRYNFGISSVYLRYNFGISSVYLRCIICDIFKSEYV